MMRWLVVVVALAGCNKIFGISEIPFAGDAGVFLDAPPDAAPAPKLEVGDPALDFGQVTQSKMSFAAPIDVTNVGDAATGVLAVTSSGALSEYTIDLGTCMNASLAPGARCRLTVTFTPQDAGTFQASLQIGDGVAMTQISLNGVGLTPGVLDMPSPVDLGSAAVSSTTNQQSITVKNTGGSTVTIETIAFSGTGSASYSTLPSSTCVVSGMLTAGASCSLMLQFKPTGGGAQLASIAVTTDAAANATSSSSLGGTGTATVTVARSGTGTGSVGSSDQAIMCGSACTATFDTATVTLTATPNAQNVVAGWSPNCQISGPNCSLSITQPTFNVNAIFTRYAVLTVALSGTAGEVLGSGLDCEVGGGPTCSVAYPPGTPVQFTAMPLSDSFFNAWSGACNSTGTSPTCVVDLSSDLMTTADFEDTAYTVDVMPLADNVADSTVSLKVGSTPCDPINGCEVHFTPATVPSSLTITATGSNCTGFGHYAGPCQAGGLSNNCTINPSGQQVTVVQFDFEPISNPIGVCAAFK